MKIFISIMFTLKKFVLINQEICEYKVHKFLFRMFIAIPLTVCIGIVKSVLH